MSSFYYWRTGMWYTVWAKGTTLNDLKQWALTHLATHDETLYLIEKTQFEWQRLRSYRYSTISFCAFVTSIIDLDSG